MTGTFRKLAGPGGLTLAAVALWCAVCSRPAAAQSLGDHLIRPPEGTQNSIFHYYVIWRYGQDRFPWAAQRYRLRGPEEVLVGEFAEVDATEGSNTVTVPLPDPDPPCQAGQVPPLPPQLIDVKGVWTNPDRRGTNYYFDGENTGSFNAATGEITLLQPLPTPLPGGKVYVQFQTNKSYDILRFKLPTTWVAVDPQYEIYEAAGYRFEPLLNEDGSLRPIDQQPGSRLRNQASGPNAEGWRTLRLPDPPNSSPNALRRVARVPAAAGNTEISFLPTNPQTGDPEIIRHVLAVSTAADGSGTNYFGSFDPCTQDGLNPVTVQLSGPLPDDFSGDLFVIYTVAYSVQDGIFRPLYRFDLFQENVDIRVGAFRVVEPFVPVDPYGDGRTFYTRASPVAGVVGVFDEWGNDYYNARVTFPPLRGSGTFDTLGLNRGRITLAQPLPPNVRSVKLIYYVGPVLLNGPGGAFQYVEPAIPGVDNAARSYTVPMCAGWYEGTNNTPARGGTRYCVSGSAGLNLANDPKSVPGLRYIPNPGAHPISWVANHIVYQDFVPQINSDTNNPEFYGRFRVGEVRLDDRQGLGGRVLASGFANPSRTEAVGAIGRDRVILNPVYDPTRPQQTATNITDVLGVWDNESLQGVNYYTGGSFDPDSNTIFLGTQLPQPDMRVWVVYTMDAPASRFGGGGLGADRIFAYPEIPIDKTNVDTAANIPPGANPNDDRYRLTPEKYYDPLIVESYLKDLGLGFLRRTDWRQFVPFNQSRPDEGNSSNTFAFRMRYFCSGTEQYPDGQPPKPWNPVADGRPGPTGAHVYVKYDGEPEYRIFGMAKELPSDRIYSRYDNNSDFGVGYLLKFEPNAGFIGWVQRPDKPNADPQSTLPNNYIAMPVGRHRYFFAASDDSFLHRLDDRDFAFINPVSPVPLIDINPNDPYANPWWTEQNPPAYREGTPLFVENTVDPDPERQAPNNRGRYTSTTRFDAYSFADRHSYLPGVEPRTWLPGQPKPPQLWNQLNSITGRAYPYPSTRYPVVHALLSGIPFGQSATGHEGGGWFLGTISPYKRAVNPSFRYPPHRPIPEVGSGPLIERHIETCGGTTSTVFTFRVIFQSFDPVTKVGRAPNYIKVFINNTADASGPYTGYDMIPAKPVSSITPDDYKNGLLYTRSMTLPAGPHTYYFEADVGMGPVRFPVRPDGRLLEPPVLTPAEDQSWSWWVDPYVPGDQYASNNDYMPGPYVNTAPVLSSHSVTPTIGPLGTEFIYRVTYRDADNQRPALTDLIIDRGDGTQLRVTMRKVVQTAENYASGVQYEYRLSSIEAASLGLGLKRYRFEFADDWGRPTDASDVIFGELVRYPSSSQPDVLNWFSGPAVTALEQPSLENGRVRSPDGTANSATRWVYEVTYRHPNNRAPSYVRVFIGARYQAGDPRTVRLLERVKPASATTVRTRAVPVLSVTGVWTNSQGQGTNHYTGGSFDPSTGEITLGTPLADASRDVWVTYAANPIIWDAGNNMRQRVPTDTVYSDGAVFEYQTTLPGPENPGDLPVDYYYSFQASDGTFVAQFNPATSPSAMAITRQPSGEGSGEVLSFASSSAGRLYATSRSPIVGPLPTTAFGDPGILLEPRVLKNGSVLRREFTGQLLPGDPAIRTVSPDGLTITVDPAVVHQVRGVYDNPNRIGTDYYSTGNSGKYNAATGVIALGAALPPGVRLVYIDYYNAGDYRIDFVNGRVLFTTANTASDNVDIEYWFAAAGPTVGQNNPPILSQGRFSPDLAGPVDGGSSTPFTFTVVYTDIDGQTGEPPAFVRVIIDGIAYPMQPVAGSSLIYSNGVTFTYTTTLSSGSHLFYFEASDGTGYAVFDAGGSRNSASVITDVVPMPGPVVNDDPRLLNGTVSPNPAAGNLPGTPVTYTVQFTDADGDAPGVGYPRVWIDNPQEIDYSGIVAAINGQTLTIQGANWQPGALAGKILQITTGLVLSPETGAPQTATAATGKTFLVLTNSANTVTIGVADPAAEGITVGDTVSIASLVMTQPSPPSTNYRQPVTYQVVTSALPIGAHTYHFSVVAPPTSTVVRFPASGELNGPGVRSAAPAGNVPPVLTAGSVSPVSGLASDTFTFRVSYSDADNDPAAPHSGVVGYVMLVFTDGAREPVLMRPAAPTSDWTSPVVHQAVIGNLPAGTHRFHFLASDGYRSGATLTRFPADATGASDPTVSINSRPVLTIGPGQGVAPANGTTSTVFTWSVTYSDADNDAPAFVRVIIDGGAPVNMTKVTPGTNYRAGVVYTYSATLGLGSHNYRFIANDGFQDAEQMPLQSGPLVQDLVEPELTEGRVDAVAGTPSTFIYSVKYRDPNGAPATSVMVFIDSQPGRAMTRDPSYSDAQGRSLYKSPPIQLAAGTHTYYFTASNGQALTRLPAGTAVFTGPVVSGASLVLNVTPSAPNLGDEIVVSGSLTPSNLNPATLTVTATREEDGSVVSRTVTTSSTGDYSVSLGPANVSGLWTISVAWGGGGGYPAQSTVQGVTVGGYAISLVRNRIDMIGLSVIPTSADPADVFGDGGTPGDTADDAATRMRLAMWSPTLNRYLIYPSDRATVRMEGGSGFWVMPTTTETVYASGRLWPQDTPYAVQLSTGWNQVASVFAMPVALGNAQVRYQGQVRTLASAAAAGWIRDYAWGWNPAAGTRGEYFLVRPGTQVTQLEPGRGYWIRALVDCELILRP